MRQPPRAPVSAATTPSPVTGGKGLRAPRPLLARGLWLTLVIAMMTILFGSLSTFQAQLRIRCTPTACNYQQLAPAQIETLNGIGVSLDGYVALTTALLLAVVAVCLAVSTLIMWRRSSDWMAVLVALMLVTLGTNTSASSVASAQAPNPWLLPSVSLLFIGTVLLLFVLFLFPSGHFAPRWMRWIAFVFLAAFVLTTCLPNTPLIPNSSVSHLSWLVVISGFAAAALDQLYRYRRESSPVLRQQTKWVALGFAMPIIVTAIVSAFALAPAFGATNALYLLVGNEIGFLLPLVIPLAFGIAILRSRLWDIDILINRALVYGSLTGILAAVYFGCVVGAQALAQALTGRATLPPAAIVASTLLIAALFNPVRRGLQTVIDRRFYRRKYDAAKTLAVFGTTLRTETDLAQLSEHVLSVVQETVQPAHVSLWLRLPERQVPQVAWRSTEAWAETTSQSQPNSTSAEDVQG